MIKLICELYFKTLKEIEHFGLTDSIENNFHHELIHIFITLKGTNTFFDFLPNALFDYLILGQPIDRCFPAHNCIGKNIH